MLLLHIVSAIAAFGPALAFPLMLRSGVQASTAQVAHLGTYIVAPGLVGTALFGYGAAGMSEGAVSSSAPWVMGASAAVAVALAVLWFLIIPGARRAVGLEGGAAERAARRLSPLIGVLHLAMVVGLWLKIWKPGA